ncbi:MAG: HIT family protein [Acholeplasmataceae bacterium]|nr:HIT family protein [Acholeplasmataceae bacterium]
MSVFKKIINREIESNIVYEDDLVIAFLDISQATKAHTLVVPKKDYQNIYQLDEKTAGHLFKVVVKISQAIKKAFQPDGLNIVNNNGAVAGQSVFHYHIHIIPRYKGDDFSIKYVNHSQDYSKEDFIKIKETIINSLS